jgi:hypothetical protein
MGKKATISLSEPKNSRVEYVIYLAHGYYSTLKRQIQGYLFQRIAVESTVFVKKVKRLFSRTVFLLF